MTDEELNAFAHNLNKHIEERFKPGIAITGVAKDKLVVMVQDKLMGPGERKMLAKHLQEWMDKNKNIKVDVRNVGKIVLAKDN